MLFGITKANPAGATDITYIPMSSGFCYLGAIMDWSSRKVPAWRLSNTLDSGFCVDALEEAITKYGCPEIFNRDQGSQFTAEVFKDTLRVNDIAISMDGKDRWRDNVFIKRIQICDPVLFPAVNTKGIDMKSCFLYTSNDIKTFPGEIRS